MRFVFEKENDEYMITDLKANRRLFPSSDKETAENICDLLNQQEEYIEYLLFCLKKEKLE